MNRKLSTSSAFPRRTSSSGGLDLFGDASYLMPGVGEVADVGYAPLQAMALGVKTLLKTTKTYQSL